jgi:sugar lactone lactonase YvrE
MRRIIISTIVVAGSSLIFSCKKNPGNTTPDTPTNEKKWVVTTLAGDTSAGFQNGQALQAKFRRPLDVAVNSDGIVYVADAFNGRIRKIAGGEVSTFVGNATGDTSNGNGTDAGFLIPSRLALDNNGNLYTLDVVDGRIRQVTPNGDASTFSGIFESGFRDGEKNIAQFGQSFGIVAGDDGNIYIADSQNKRIRKIDSAGQVKSIAGTGAAAFVDGNSDTAQFYFPAGIVNDKHGNLFIGDRSRIRKISTAGVVSTFVGIAGSGFMDGNSDQAQFTLIEDMVIDDQDNIYVTDQNRIRKITAEGMVSTIAGTGDAGFKDGIGSSAKFDGPQGLGIDKQGNIYVADFNNNCIRKISFE